MEHFTDMIADETICTEDPGAAAQLPPRWATPVLGMEPFDMC